jgi:hypothetical protein
VTARASTWTPKPRPGIHTQFTAPGWQYLDASSGYLGGNRANGSYVSLKSPNGRDYSTIIETMDATGAQTLTFTVAGGLSRGTVHVWSTNVRSNNPADYFAHSADLAPAGVSYSLTVQPGHIYSITTTTGQGKGTATSHGQGALALPYNDSFDGHPLAGEAKYLMDIQGAFEVSGCGGGRDGTVVGVESRAVPGRDRRRHRERQPGGDLDVQRRRKPAMDR